MTATSDLAPVGLPRAASPIPLYYQVFLILSQRIADGTYGGSEKFGTEDRLAVEFSVSRATIRQALAELETAGLIARKQGKGTFVSAQRPPTVGLRFQGSLADLFSETDRAQVADVDFNRHVRLPEHISKLLLLDRPVGTVIRRTRMMEGQTFAYTVNYMSDVHGELLSLKELRRSSLMHILQRKGLELVSGNQTIRAQVADPTVSQHLHISLGAPVLFVERIIFGRQRVPVEFVQTWYRGDIYEYTVALHLRKDQGPEVR